MSSRGAEPHDREPARQPTLAAYAPEPVLPPAASAPDWRSRQGRWVDRSLSGRHHLPCCRGLFRPVAKSNPCTIPRSKRQRPSYRSRPHTPNLWIVPFMQRMPQLTGWRACRAVAALTPEDMHDFPDPLDRDLSVFRVAVPDPPAQPLDLLDNERLCLHPGRFVGRQRTRRQLRVLKPHRDMKPIENRWLGHARSGQDRPKAGTTIGERGQVTVVGSAHGLEVSANQRRDVGVALRNSAKYLPTSARRLDVADENL